MKRLLIIWGKWGPYHCARYEALQKAGSERGWDIYGMEYNNRSHNYKWEPIQDNAKLRSMDIASHDMEFSVQGLIFKIFPYIKEIKADVVVIPGYWNWSLCIAIFCKLSGIKTILMSTTHKKKGTENFIKRTIKKSILNFYDSGIVGGKLHKDYLNSLGFSKITDGYNCVDNISIQSAADNKHSGSTKIHAKLNLPRKYFLFVGKLSALKNVNRLIEAFAEFKKENPEAEEELVLAGCGEKEEELRKLCTSLSLSTNLNHTDSSNMPPIVQFIGFRQFNEMPAIYAKASALILPSHNETWGLVINEAMAAGTTVIASKNCGCVDELFINKLSNDSITIKNAEIRGSGIIFEPKDVKALADCLQFITTNPSLASEMSDKAREIISRYSTDKFALNLIDSADELLESKV